MLKSLLLGTGRVRSKETHTQTHTQTLTQTHTNTHKHSHTHTHTRKYPPHVKQSTKSTAARRQRPRRDGARRNMSHALAHARPLLQIPGVEVGLVQPSQLAKTTTVTHPLTDTKTDGRTDRLTD